jgi:hypothetical protein
MFHIRPEGEAPKQGFNFYPLKEWKTSRGFWLKIKNWSFIFRYSPRREKWFMYRHPHGNS